jgi:hypothetical protein
MLCRDCKNRLNNRPITESCAIGRSVEVVQGYGCDEFKAKVEPEPAEKPKPAARR